MRLGAKIFGALAGVFILFLLLGWLLPGSWKAEVETVLPAPPSTVFPFVNRMDLWVLWNPMPESGSESLGPQEGVGAGLQWSDPQYGEGRFQILVSEGDSVVEYQVLVEGGALEVHGVISLRPEGGGTRLHWSEDGDFGRNPLMGYTARRMASAQGEVMHARLSSLLARLAEESS